MKLENKSFKFNTIWSFCSFDKTGAQIRLAAHSNSSTQLSMTLQKVADGDYTYGWKEFKSIITMQERFATVAPVDVIMALDGVAVADLKDKADILSQMFIVEYSMQRVYKPLSLPYVKDALRAQEMSAIILNNLSHISSSDMAKIMKAVPRLSKTITKQL